MDRSEPAGIDPFAFIEPALGSADIAAVNAEMAISDRGSPIDKQFVFRAPPAAAARMAAAGVDVASLANNHARDYGPEALLDTVALLEEVGITALGAGADDTEAYRHRTLEVAGGVRVAFVGAAMVVPWSFPAGDDRPGIASARPPERVISAVSDAAEDADVVIVSIHWGSERHTCPTAEQIAVAGELFRAGATVLLGHHPHVMQPVEFDGGRLVAYSLGNFVWHPRGGLTGETGVLSIDFDGGEIVGWDFHPHLLDDQGAPRPADEGWRVDRIRSIVDGNCAPHMPPPPPPPTTTTTTTTQPDPNPAPTESDTATTTTTTSQPDPTQDDGDPDQPDPAPAEGDPDQPDPTATESATTTTTTTQPDPATAGGAG